MKTFRVHVTETVKITKILSIDVQDDENSDQAEVIAWEKYNAVDQQLVQAQYPLMVINPLGPDRPATPDEVDAYEAEQRKDSSPQEDVVDGALAILQDPTRPVRPLDPVSDEHMASRKRLHNRRCASCNTYLNDEIVRLRDQGKTLTEFPAKLKNPDTGELRLTRLKSDGDLEILGIFQHCPCNGRIFLYNKGSFKGQTTNTRTKRWKQQSKPCRE